MNTVIDILKIKNVEKIGSSADPNIKYASDVDLQEFVQTDDFFETILHKFQDRFRKAERNPNVFITDMKCGKFRGLPVRWNKQSIKRGHQYIDNIKINLVDCLQQKSIIKMDIIALIDGVFTEFSNNYYFTFSDGFTTMPISTMKLSDIFLHEFQEKMRDKKYFKALKRLYSYFKVRKNKKYQNKLITFFNSDIGKLNYQINGLQIIYDVIGNSFRTPKKSDVRHNLLVIQKNLPNEYKSLIDQIMNKSTLSHMKPEMKKTIDQLTEVVNQQTMNFIDKEIEYSTI